MDDHVVGDDASLRDRKRQEVYGPWLALAREDDFVGVQNYERAWYDGEGAVDESGEHPGGGLYSGVHPGSLARAVRYVHEAAGVPVLVTEHGMATDDDTRRAGFIEPSLAGLLDAIQDGVPVLGFHQHTDPESKRVAEEAGVAIVVPRSRLMREMPELVDGLLR